MRALRKNLYIHLSHYIYILLYPYCVSVTGSRCWEYKQGAAYLTMNKEKKSLGDID